MRTISTRVTRSHLLRALVAAGTATSVALLSPGTAAADTTANASAKSGPAVHVDPAAAVSRVRAHPHAAPVWATRSRPVPAWPAAARASARLTGTGPVAVPGTPVTLAPARAGSPAATAEVRVFPRAVGASAGTGAMSLVVGVGSDHPGTPLRVSVDARGVAASTGGDWIGRAHLVELTGCQVTASTVSGCTGRTDLRTSRDAAGHLTATATTTANMTVVAATAAPAGSTGDYAATPLNAATSWHAGGQSGSFTWSDPISAPPAPGGLTPRLAVAYDSGSVDGRVAAANNQPSWLGDGFDLAPGGYIERRYVACNDDKTNGNNAALTTGDLCWKSDNATLALAGHSGPLVKDSTSGTWRLFEDDGSRISHSGTPGAAGEYWTLTTIDGTTYTFGKGSPAVGSGATASAWSAPVFGNQAGEPCYVAGNYAASACQNAVWRWNLDSVVDAHGNAMTFYYTPETNNYGENANHTVVSYTRGGYLNRIDYGLRTDASSTPAAGRVTFTTAERCIPDATFTDCSAANLTSATASYWPDVPFDQICTAATGTVSSPTSGGCVNVQSPAFFTRIRLTGLTTAVASGSTYTTADTWSFGQKFLDPGDTTSQLLWTSTIAHTGNDGGTLAAPTVTLVPMSQPTPNRVDAVGDGAPAINRFRLSWVDDGVGGTTSVGYTPIDCTSTSKPTDPSTNTRRCYPVYYLQPGATSPTLNWFNKYLVSRVVATDAVAGQPDVTTSYQYLGGAAWHFDRSDLVPAAERTWGQFRGYGTVRTFTGGNTGPWTASEELYLRGMNGDCADTGCTSTKSVTVTDSRGGTITDTDLYNDFTRQSRTFNGGTPTFDSSGNVTASTVRAALTDTLNTPALGAVTAADGTRSAQIRSRTGVNTRTLRGDGSYTQVTTTTSYDAYGQPVTDESATADAGTTCTRTSYANDTTHWIHDAVTSTETVNVPCATTPSRPGNLLSGSRTLYDGATTWSATPTLTHADPTTEQALTGWDGTNNVGTYLTKATTGYDVVGRVTTSTDADGNTTTTTYTPATAGPVTAVSTAQPLGLTSSLTLDPARGTTLTSTDPNNNVTTSRYDPLGRLTGVWLPGRSTAATASRTFSYTLGSATTPSSVTAGVLQNNGTYTNTVTYYDGQLRPVETQSPSMDGTAGARLDTQTLYDEQGNKSAEVGPAKDTTGAPGTGLVNVSDATTPLRTSWNYDGARRVTTTTTRAGIGNAAWHSYTTNTSYNGDATTTTPPAGGTISTVILDSRGHTKTLRQYTTSSGTSGASQDTSYTYRADGLLASMKDPAGNTWTHSYDLQGQLTSSNDPDAGTTTTGYDKVGRVSTVTDGRGSTIAYAYDALGRRTAEHTGSVTGPTIAAWTYDTVTGGKGQPATSTSYDASGNAYTRSITGYDSWYHPTGTSLTIPTSETGLAGTYTTTLRYNLDGQIKNYLMPTIPGVTALSQNPGYNALGQPVNLSTGTGIVAGTTYSAYGQPTRETLGSGSNLLYLTYAYADGTRRLTGMSATRSTGTGTLVNTSYTQDDAGNLTKVTDAPTDPAIGSTAVDTQCFTYDPLAHLTGAWTPANSDCITTPTATALGGPAPYWTSWTYNLATGTRATQTSHATDGTTATTTSSYPPAGAAHPHALSGTTGAATTSYGYDGAGNTTSATPSGQTATSYTWDPNGHLATTTGPAGNTSNTYDADGALLITRDPTGKTLFADTTTEIRYTTATGALSLTHHYTWTGRPIADSFTTGGLTFQATDPHHTGLVAVTNSQTVAAVRRYDPFGNTRGTSTGTWPDSHGYLDKPVNTTTGLTHLGARDYNPATGAFISVDPLLDLADPTQWNPYSYADHNPATLTDPDGTRPTCLDEGDCTTIANSTGGTHNSTKASDGYLTGPPSSPSSYYLHPGPLGNAPLTNIWIPSTPTQRSQQAAYEAREAAYEAQQARIRKENDANAAAAAAAQHSIDAMGTARSQGDGAGKVADGAAGWAKGLAKGQNARPGSVKALEGGAEKLGTSALAVGTLFTAYDEWTYSKSHGYSNLASGGRVVVRAGSTALVSATAATAFGSAGAATGAMCGPFLEVCSPILGSAGALAGGVWGWNIGNAIADWVIGEDD